MRSPFLTILKVELFKFIKRKDFISLLGFIAIALIMAISMKTNSYNGINEKQSGLFWICSQFVTASTLIVAPLILAFNSSRVFALEVENNNILLMNAKIRDRKKLFAAKSTALLFIGTFYFVISFLVYAALYFLIASGGNFTTGTLFGNNSKELILIILMIYIGVYLLVPQITLFLGTVSKPTVSMVLTVAVVLLCSGTTKVEAISFMNPMYYIFRLANDVLETTSPLHIPSANIYAVGLTALCIVLIFVFNYMGIKNFEKRDL